MIRSRYYNTIKIIDKYIVYKQLIYMCSKQRESIYSSSKKKRKGTSGIIHIQFFYKTPIIHRPWRNVKITDHEYTSIISSFLTMKIIFLSYLPQLFIPHSKIYVGNRRTRMYHIHIVRYSTIADTKIPISPSSLRIIIDKIGYWIFTIYYSTYMFHRPAITITIWICFT